MRTQDIIPYLMKLPREYRVGLARMLIKPEDETKKLSHDDAIALAGVLLSIIEPNTPGPHPFGRRAWEMEIPAALDEIILGDSNVAQP